MGHRREPAAPGGSRPIRRDPEHPADRASPADCPLGAPVPHEPDDLAPHRLPGPVPLDGISRAAIPNRGAAPALARPGTAVRRTRTPASPLARLTPAGRGSLGRLPAAGPSRPARHAHSPEPGPVGPRMGRPFGAPPISGGRHPTAARTAPAEQHPAARAAPANRNPAPRPGLLDRSTAAGLLDWCAPPGARPAARSASPGERSAALGACAGAARADRSTPAGAGCVDRHAPGAGAGCVDEHVPARPGPMDRHVTRSRAVLLGRHTSAPGAAASGSCPGTRPVAMGARTGAGQARTPRLPAGPPASRSRAAARPPERHRPGRPRRALLGTARDLHRRGSRHARVAGPGVRPARHAALAGRDRRTRGRTRRRRPPLPAASDRATASHRRTVPVRRGPPGNVPASRTGRRTPGSTSRGPGVLPRRGTPRRAPAMGRVIAIRRRAPAARLMAARTSHTRHRSRLRPLAGPRPAPGTADRPRPTRSRYATAGRSPAGRPPSAGRGLRPRVDLAVGADRPAGHPPGIGRADGSPSPSRGRRRQPHPALKHAPGHARPRVRERRAPRRQPQGDGDRSHRTCCVACPPPDRPRAR